MEDKNDAVALLFLLIFAARGGAEEEALCVFFIIAPPPFLDDDEDELRIIIIIRRRRCCIPGDVAVGFPSGFETLFLIIIIVVAFERPPREDEEEGEVEKPRWWLWLRCVVRERGANCARMISEEFWIKKVTKRCQDVEKRVLLL